MYHAHDDRYNIETYFSQEYIKCIILFQIIKNIINKTLKNRNTYYLSKLM